MTQEQPRKYNPDFSMIRGHEHIKRALEIAVAGNHSIVITGGPGQGKTMLIAAALQMVNDGEWCYVNGFSKTIDWATINDALNNGYMLALEKWPCPCGYSGSYARECLCTARQIIDYNMETYPLAAKSEIHVEAPALDWDKISDTRPGEDSQRIMGRITRAREIQSARYTNGQLNGKRDQIWDLTFFKQLDTACLKLLKAAQQQLQMTPESVFNVVRIARTIADLSDSTKIQAAYIAEAVQYRPRRPLLGFADQKGMDKHE